MHIASTLGWPASIEARMSDRHRRPGCFLTSLPGLVALVVGGLMLLG